MFPYNLKSQILGVEINDRIDHPFNPYNAHIKITELPNICRVRLRNDKYHIDDIIALVLLNLTKTENTLCPMKFIPFYYDELDKEFITNSCILSKLPKNGVEVFLNCGDTFDINALKFDTTIIPSNNFNIILVVWDLFGKLTIRKILKTFKGITDKHLDKKMIDQIHINIRELFIPVNENYSNLSIINHIYPLLSNLIPNHDHIQQFNLRYSVYTSISILQPIIWHFIVNTALKIMSGIVFLDTSLIEDDIFVIRYENKYHENPLYTYTSEYNQFLNNKFIITQKSNNKFYIKPFNQEFTMRKEFFSASTQKLEEYKDEWFSKIIKYIAFISDIGEIVANSLTNAKEIVTVWHANCIAADNSKMKNPAYFK